MSNAELAAQVYAYCEERYGTKGARYDVIVECMSKQEIADELAADGITAIAAGKAWADRRAGLHHEQELNQAWDGPESCIGSELYQPEKIEPSDRVGPEWDDDISLEERFEHYAFEERNGMPYGSSF